MQNKTKKIQNKYVATLITLRVYKEDEKKKENKGKSFSNENLHCICKFEPY